MIKKSNLLKDEKSLVSSDYKISKKFTKIHKNNVHYEISRIYAI